MDSNETLGEKVRWELYKDATQCFEQILVAAPYKTVAVLPLTFHHKNRPRRTEHVEQGWKSKDELISDIF